MTMTARRTTTSSSNDNDSAPVGDVRESKQAIDPVVLSHAISQAMERALPLIQDYLENRGQEAATHNYEPMMALHERLTSFMAVLFSNPRRLAELQFEYWQKWNALWQNTIQKLSGEATEDLYKPLASDRRFRSAEWSENLLFDFIKQSYLMTSGWMHRVVRSTEGLDKGMLDEIDFYTRQFADAMAPTNFILTNPEVLRETVRSGGENLVKGLENLLEDMERGRGEIKISTTRSAAFKLGENLAVTKGSVIFRNEMIELIQYAPATPQVFKTPLLIVPPWINKYYILDMRPENSFVKWLVDQGHTVFMISWVNPGAAQAGQTFENYMTGGLFAALDQVELATGEKQTNVMGYCLGGTLLAMALSWMAEKGQAARVRSVSFLTTLIDFKDAGELKLFTDETQIEAMEKSMTEKGVLSGDTLQKTFSVLRANDMIWSFVINNYLMGREPFPFDLLYWNEDVTNMPCAMHSFYLRNMYLENKLIEPGGLTFAGVPLDIRKIKAPAYFLSTREDHIAPWKATYAGYQAYTGEKKFTLSASGHVAGIVNPPAADKYGYWENDREAPTSDQWLGDTSEVKASWWTNWQSWVLAHTGAMVPAREITSEVEPAPGRYVRASAEQA